MAQIPATSVWTHETHHYVPDSPTPESHTLETWTPALPLSPTTSKLWIVYIHGGAWWRPMITASSFYLTVSSLTSSPLAAHIGGFASLNYRLSAPPPLPQFAEFTKPSDPGRNVKHPAHLDDVTTALAWLQATFGFDGNYVLVGHSCGATLAFQLQGERGSGGVAGPRGILGVEGIYDLTLLVRNHESVPMYRLFTESAFGTNEQDWRRASPATQEGDGPFAWEMAEVVAIAQSREDELVDEAQANAMWDLIEKVGGKAVSERIGLLGKHDEVWKVIREGDRGTQVGVAIERMLELLMKQ